MNIFWSDWPLQPPARSLLEAQGELRLPPLRQAPNIELLEEADAALVGPLFPGTAETFARSPRLRILARLGIGCDNIDIPAASAAGICVVNTPDAPTESTAEFTICLMLAVARNLMGGAVPFSRGEWKKGPQLLGMELAGKTLGLIGCGRIGRRVAKIAQALLMDVMAFDPALPQLPDGIRKAADLSDLLRNADVLSVHVPLTARTRHLVGAAELAELKAGAIVINAARGPLIDERALLAALDTGRLAGAGIDVWEPEPPPADNPLLGHPRVVATPHIAAYTREGQARSHVAAAEQVIQIVRGERPAGLLNPEIWETRRMGAG